MKNIAALVSLSVGLFCLFSDNAQAQRARWSGNGANSGYEFSINLDVTDQDPTTNGFYPVAVDYFRYTVPQDNLDNPNRIIFSDAYKPGIDLISSGGNLTIKKYNPNQDTIYDAIEMLMNFDSNSPIKSSKIIIMPNQDSGIQENFNNVDLNNLFSFYEQLSTLKADGTQEGSIVIDTANSEIIFKDGVLKQGTGETFQSSINSINIDRNSKAVTEPNLGYSSLLMLPFIAIYLRKSKHSEATKIMPNQTTLNQTINL